MRLKNHTDLSDELVRDIIRFVCPPGVARFDVRVSNYQAHRTYRGRAYTNGSSYHDRAGWFIVASIGKAPIMEARSAERGRGGYLPVPPLSRVEALVYLLAHELRHLWQRRVPRGRRVWGARGQFSERDACAYGLNAVRRWRREAPTVLLAA